MTQLQLSSGYIAIGVAAVACLFLGAMSLLFIALRISSILSLQQPSRVKRDKHAEDYAEDLTPEEEFQVRVDEEIKRRQQDRMAHARAARVKK